MLWPRLLRHPAVPAALLSLAVVATALLTWEAVVSARRARATAEGVLTDYATFAARQFERESQSRLDQRVAADLRSVRHQAENHDARLDTTRHMGPGPACCPLSNNVRSTFAWTPSATTVLTGPPLPEALVNALRDDASRDPGVLPRVQMLAAGEIAVLGLARPQGQPGLVGIVADAAWMTDVFARVMDEAPLLPRALAGESQSSMVVVRVLDAGGREQYRSMAGDSPFAGRAELPARLGGLVVEALIPRESASRLIIGGLPGDRWPLAVGLLILASGLAVAAVIQLRRETRFARERADFVSGVSHELRTPLAQIRLFGETLLLGRMRSLEDERRAAAVIVTESIRLGQMVDNILRFTRTGRRPLAGTREPVDLAMLAGEVVDAFRPLAASKDAAVELDVDIDAGRAPAWIDPNACRHILVNLLDNAVKYGPRGQTVRMKIARATDQLSITVEDDGPGVPVEHRDKVWEPYWRAPDSPEGGAGLGLSNVRELAAGMGGVCRVGSSASGGAQFVVELDARPPS